MEFRDAWSIACKDLRIELRSRILTNQIAPYTLLIVVLFGFAGQGFACCFAAYALFCALFCPF